jgi:hypothetical protein
VPIGEGCLVNVARNCDLSMIARHVSVIEDSPVSLRWNGIMSLIQITFPGPAVVFFVWTSIIAITASSKLGHCTVRRFAQILAISKPGNILTAHSALSRAPNISARSLQLDVVMVSPPCSTCTPDLQDV